MREADADANEALELMRECTDPAWAAAVQRERHARKDAAVALLLAVREAMARRLAALALLSLDEATDSS